MKRLTKIFFWISLFSLEFDFIYYILNQRHNLTSIKILLATYVITIILLVIEKLEKRRK